MLYELITHASLFFLCFLLNTSPVMTMTTTHWSKKPNHSLNQFSIKLMSITAHIKTITKYKTLAIQIYKKIKKFKTCTKHEHMYSLSSTRFFKPESDFTETSHFSNSQFHSNSQDTGNSWFNDGRVHQIANLVITSTEWYPHFDNKVNSQTNWGIFLQEEAIKQLSSKHWTKQNLTSSNHLHKSSFLS